MSDLPDQLPPKREVARALLVRGSVFVHLDPRRPEVVVPPWLAARPQLVLQVGLDMPVPIPDLRIDDRGVFATLSFNRAPFRCEVPWDAVFALVGEDAKGMVWPEQLPDELAAEVEREARRRSGDRGAVPAPPGETVPASGPSSPRPTIPPPPPTAPLDALRAASPGGATSDPSDDRAFGETPRPTPMERPGTASENDRRGLRVVEGGASPRPASDSPAERTGGKTRGRSRPPYLRVVK